MTPLSSRFDDALVFANHLHRQQRRKGTQTPYVSHLLGVCALVLEAGGDEDEAIGALLHDAVEDQGGLPTLADIGAKFGARVAAIVEGCTDADEVPKPPWRERKEAYLAHLPSADASVLRVSIADKIYNAHSIANDLYKVGDEVWKRFAGGKTGTLWYYRALVTAYRKSVAAMWPQTQEFDRIVTELERLAHE